MKKIILLLLFSVSMLFADAKVYMGVFGGVANESFNKPANTSATSTTAKINIGYGNYKSYSVELGFLYDKGNKTVFAQNGNKDGARYSVDFMLTKAFDFGVNFYPFFTVGFEGGYFSTYIPTTSGVKKSLNFSSLNGGIGFNYRLFKDVILQVSGVYKHRNYERAEPTSTTSAQTGSNVIVTLVGIMYRF